MKQISVSLTDEQIKELDRLAKSQSRSRSQMARVVVIERLELNREERRATGQTSLHPNTQKTKWDDECIDQFGK